MTWPTVAATAVVVAGVAALLAPWVASLADAGAGESERVSRWTGRAALAVLGGLGGAAAGAVASTPAELVGFGALGLGSALLVATDQARHRLPDAITLPTGVVLVAALAVAASQVPDWPALGRALGAGAAVGLGFLLLALISPRALGLGDVKLGALLGVAAGWLGWPTVLTALVASFVLGGAVALVLLVARVATRSTAIPFGPWLVLGAWSAYLAARLTTAG